MHLSPLDMSDGVDWFEDDDYYDDYGEYLRPCPCTCCHHASERPHAAYQLDDMARLVGGIDVLHELDAQPLPDEAFAWDAVPDYSELVAVVSEVVGQCDDVCGTLLDVEHRTACRRLVARAAAGGADWFLSGRPPAAMAGSALWLILRMNGSARPRNRGPRMKDIAAHLGLKANISGRYRGLIQAAGLRDVWPQIGGPGAADLLVARRRLELRDERDRWREELARYRSVAPWSLV